MIKIIENVKYIIEIKDFSFGPIPKEVLIKNFKDGRAFGLIGEYILPAISGGKIKKTSGNKAYDFSKKGIKIEQRTLTEGGLNLIPSNQIGSGRSYNIKKFKNKLDSIDWIFIIDNSKFPFLEAVFVKASKIELDQHRYRYNSAREKFFGCKKEVTLEI
jgi:hypothetical protein